ncbi:MAG: amino acid permease, partial [Gemmatimonadales bacterium]
MGHVAHHPKESRRAPVRRGRQALPRRALGPFNLTALGIGSVIGTGIFVLTGTAASQNAGPALVISMVIAAVACALAGLCYAELASM